ncbi:hypothetical protein QOZ80_3AG0227660 [Eleusine coracana subsp. coracana]|nr:hypothetical protein QOZ80_3AG0227660 [Eleusine coracana subsp. coracana]
MRKMNGSSDSVDWEQQAKFFQPALNNKSWKVVTPGGHKRKVNFILGLLCREHFPGQVHIGTRYEPAWTWKHYEAAPDQFDQLNRCYPSKADRVVEEMWDFYKCKPGHEEDAKVVAHNRYRKLVKDMHYEAQVQCVINYTLHVIGRRIKKEEARTMKLTQEQYLKSQAYDGVECPEFVGWALAHKGKASQATYDPNDPSSSYTNSSFYSRISAYTEMGKQVHGPEWDPAAHPLDGEVIIRAGGGRKHGRFIIGDGPARRREKAKARVEASQQAEMAMQQARQQEWEARQQADMANLLAYLQAMHAQMGGSLPPLLTMLCLAPSTP